MTVTLTSEALGKVPGDTYTGPEEAWLLAEGYAKQAAYAGPGVANTGATTVAPALDLTLAVNREGLVDPLDPPAGQDPFGDSAPDYDFDPGQVDNDAPEVFDPEPGDVGTADAGLEPNTGGTAGGTVVTITGDNLKDVTAVTFGGTAGTALTKDADDSIRVTTPAHAAGAVTVVLTDPSGTKTVTNGFTYA